MTDLTPNPLPAAWPTESWGGHAMALDTRRDVVVFFPGSRRVGFSGLSTFPVWEWNRVGGWNDRSAVGAQPWAPPSYSAWVAYDAKRGVTVVVVDDSTGASPAGVISTTEWNGIGFTSATPGPTFPAAVTYDPVHEVVVLFGGLPARELWTWDGANWKNMTPAVIPLSWPTASYSAVMTWDSAASRVDLVASDPSYLSPHVWAWDGSVWADLTPTLQPTEWPSATLWDGAVFDPCQGAMMLFGGSDELWEWDSATEKFRNLTPAMPGTAWPRLGQHDLVFDSARDEMILFGGLGDMASGPSLFTYGPLP